MCSDITLLELLPHSPETNEYIWFLRRLCVREMCVIFSMGSSLPNPYKNQTVKWVIFYSGGGEASHCHKQTWPVVVRTIKGTIQEHVNQTTTLFLKKKSYHNGTCKMLVILSSLNVSIVELHVFGGMMLIVCYIKYSLHSPACPGMPTLERKWLWGSGHG